MNPAPRFQAEFFIRENIAALDAYVEVFNQRIVASFAHLHEEAEAIIQRAYKQLGAGCTENDDPGMIAEQAQDRGIEYYGSVNAVRQGILNLMVAGLYHLLEQHIEHTLEIALPRMVKIGKTESPFRRLDRVLQAEGIAMSGFASWRKIDELRLIAGCVKHGDGTSATDLRKLRPELFQDEHPLFAGLPRMTPLRPIMGDGIILLEKHFAEYAVSVRQFWEELIAALQPVMCRHQAQVQTP